MTPPPSLVDRPLMVGSVHESDQEIHLDGVVTHTRARALRMPWWALVLVVHFTGVDQLARDIVGMVL